MSEAKKTVSVQSDQPDDIVRQLAPLREAIDDTDRQLLALLNDRAELVRQVGHVKQGGRRSPVYVASRERDLVSALVRSNPGPFPDGAIGPVFREIISATRSLEDQVRVVARSPVTAKLSKTRGHGAWTRPQELHTAVRELDTHAVE